jgi:endonuclease YncB( thermonuclease family)
MCCAIATIASCAGSDTATGTGAAEVIHVIDGDTIDVQIGGREERVRLIGIDTPETKKPNSPIECFGPEASAFTASLLPIGTRVRIERDLVGRDDYGRLLGYVYVDDVDGTIDTFVNMEIIRQGYATPLTIEPNSTYAREFASAAGEAEVAGLGLWTACSP